MQMKVAGNPVALLRWELITFWVMDQESANQKYMRIIGIENWKVGYGLSWVS